MASTSIALRTGHIRTLSRRLDCGPWEATTDVLMGYLGRYSGHTLRSVASSVTGFYGWGARSGRIARDPIDGQVRVVSRPSPRPRPAPETAYVEALLRSDRRTRLMLRLAAELGLRRAEVAQVHAEDVHADLLGRSLLVKGKGGRQRQMPLPDNLADEITGQAAGGWAFPSPTGGHLSPQWVGEVVSDALGEGLTMHQLRHRFATRAYLVGRDLPVVQQLLGHSSPATTMHYVAVPADALRATVAEVGRLVPAA